MQVYARIAQCLLIQDVISDVNSTWCDIAADSLHKIVQNQLPSGSGFDTTPELTHNGSPTKEFTISGSYHKMDEHGGYDGWVNFSVKVFAVESLVHHWDISVELNPKDEDLQDYIEETYFTALNAEWTP